MCLKNPSCKYWTWLENYKGNAQYCMLKDANPGLTNLEGVISGAKSCIGKAADPNQCRLEAELIVEALFVKIFKKSFFQKNKNLLFYR